MGAFVRGERLKKHGLLFLRPKSQASGGFILHKTGLVVQPVPNTNNSSIYNVPDVTNKKKNTKCSIKFELQINSE